MALTDKKEPVDIELEVGLKQRFRLNGNNKQVIELNPNDSDIIHRLQDAYPVVNEVIEKIANLDTEAENFRDELKNCDKKIREQIDYIFDSPVSDICVPSGNMYDLYGGEFAYEKVIRTLSKLYEEEFANEYKKLKNRIQNRASKYVSKGKSNKSKK